MFDAFDGLVELGSRQQQRKQLVTFAPYERVELLEEVREPACLDEASGKRFRSSFDLNHPKRFHT